MPLPKAIQRQADAAEAIAAQFANPSMVVDPNTGEPLTQTAPVAVQPVEQAPAPAPRDDFEQKYRSMQGKYDAEIPVLRQQAQTFERINTTLGAQLAQVSEELNRLRAAPAPQTPAAPVRAVNDKDVETFGSELIDLISRVSAAQMGSLESKLASHLTEIKQAVGRTNSEVGTVRKSQEQTDRALYEQRLTEVVPNWRAINANPDWLAWLNEFDAVLGGTRQAALSDAYAKFDSNRTVAFLHAYLALPRSRPATAARTPQEELARQQSPRASASQAQASPQSTAAETRFWTQREIGDFYTAVLQGKFKGNPGEKARIEAQIDEAVATGRVR